MRHPHHHHHRGPSSALIALGLCALLLCFGTQGARAQDRISAEGLSPATDVSGSILSVYGSRPLSPGNLSFHVFGSYARAPLGLQDGASGKDIGNLAGSIGTLSILGGWGITDWLDVGVAIPVHRVSKGSDFGIVPPPALVDATVNESSFGMGDVRLVPRVRFAGPAEGEDGVGFSGLVQVYLPTGRDEIYAGESIRFEPRIALDYVRRRLRLAANVGYMVRPAAQLLDTTVDDFITWGVGTELPLGDSWSILAEVFGHINVLEDSLGSEDMPTELLAGLRYQNSGWLMQLGGGPGLIDAPVAPQWRLFLAAGYSPAQPQDSDGDGLLDDNDQCPTQAEDKDGFEDSDGCPDPDNDGDGVPDAQDQCANEAEDSDDFQDEDGCPDPDNDGDGILDTTDRCPAEPEDADGFEDEDGCPDPDNDGDGVLDGADKCPNEAGPAEESGCPAPEPVAAPEPEPVSAVTVTDKTLEIADKVYFDKAKASIDERSFALLDEVARVLNAHPELTRVRVEGHTDSRGKPAYNNNLSNERAKSVVSYLVNRGVAKDRIFGRGFGSSRPVATNDTKEGRAQNRRVAFTIKERAAGDAAAAPKAEPAAGAPATPAATPPAAKPEAATPPSAE